MAVSDKQRGVLHGMAAAALATLVALSGALWFSPDLLVPADDLKARLAFVATCDLLVVFWLLIAVGSLARHRFFSPEDIDGGGLTEATEAARIRQALLQNTLEQVVLALAVHLTGAVLLPTAWLPVLPAAAILFALGRFLFWRGYRRGAAARALGFGLTFYPTILLFLLLLLHLLLPN